MLQSTIVSNYTSKPAMHRLRNIGLPLTAAIVLLTGLYLATFLGRTALMLAHPFPLDYGEGPLLAQIETLRAGVPIWSLYRDPNTTPFFVVNYPPLYLLLTTALSIPFQHPLLVGRLLSLLATLGAAFALARLANLRPRLWPLTLLIFTIPIVREWALLLRVDMLGVCLGLWGLVVISSMDAQPNPKPWRPIIAGMLLFGTLYTKPALIAAPLAGGMWLGLLLIRGDRTQRRAALISLAALIIPSVVCTLLLQWASDGWFLLHIISANANHWDASLASAFWRDQLDLRGALVPAALIALILSWRTTRSRPLLALLAYLIGGSITALGVGKVGAYANYFLECYGALLGLIMLGLQQTSAPTRHPWQPAILLPLLLSLLFYPPSWSATQLRPAGLIEPAPPRLIIGRYSLVRDLQREAEVLPALARVQTALVADVQAAGTTIFTDMPGVAASAGVLSRMQVFEQRQLFDQALADQTPLLVELANGTLPLAVIDYLGNWMPPQMVTLIQRRYAHDGALGTFDRYRPVAPGPREATALTFDNLQLTGVHVAPPPGNLRGSYEPGAPLLVTLEWLRQHNSVVPAITPMVQLQLRDATGNVVQTSARPLLYGALPPTTWPIDTPIQHLQPITIPAMLQAGRYTVTIEVGAPSASAWATVATITVAAQGGRTTANYFVPAPFQAAWLRLGGAQTIGDPLTPAVPFAWGTLQCFVTTCLELRGDHIVQRPLGAQLYLGETLRGERCNEGSAPVGSGPCSEYAPLATSLTQFILGPALSGTLRRNGYDVQWTRYARLERNPTTGDLGLGRLGDDSLRLPAGMPYRWP